MNLIETFLEVQLIEEDNFLKIKETLTRIGVASRKEKKLYQSCHILHKQNKYYLVHFKQMFALDGKWTDFTDEDRNRTNTIALLLQEWNLLRVLKSSDLSVVPMNQIKVIAYKDKSDWTLISKYTIGKRKNTERI
jgi:hypothetical protein